MPASSSYSSGRSRRAEYFGSSPYWNTAVVGRPFGSAEPENPAPVAVTVGGCVVSTELGGALIVAESVTVEVPRLVPTEVIVTAIGYVPGAA